MKFTIGKSVVNIDFADNDGADDIARKFVSNADVAAALAQHASTFHFRAWDNEGSLDQSSIDKVAGIALEKGVDAAVDYMVENNYDVNPSDHYRNLNGDGSTTKFVSDFLASMSDARGWEEGSDEYDELADRVVEVAGEYVEQRFADTDNSQPSDVFAARDTTIATFVQGYGSKGLMPDIETRHVDSICHSSTVIPDRNLMLQFKLFNLSPVEFVEYFKNTRGEDLRKPEFGDDVSDYYRNQLRENAKGWKIVCAACSGDDLSELDIPEWLEPSDRDALAASARSCRDLDRAQVASTELAIELLDNATYGGVGFWTGSLNAREIMQGGFEKSFSATGGILGIHDFEGGGGHSVLAPEGVLIDLTEGRLFTETSYRNTPHRASDFTRNQLRCQTKSAEVSEWVRFKSDGWRSTAETSDGVYAEINRIAGDDVTLAEYEVSYKNAENHVVSESFRHAGPIGGVKELARSFLKFEPATADHATSVKPGI